MDSDGIRAGAQESLLSALALLQHSDPMSSLACKQEPRLTHFDPDLSQWDLLSHLCGDRHCLRL